MSIITGGLGEDSKLITQGYGPSKWEKGIETHEKHFLEMCPSCGSNLKQSGYSHRDPFTGKRIIRCKNCYHQIAYDNGIWIIVD